LGVEWFKAKLNKELTIINDLFDKFRISEALMATYKLIWDDFCSWYLEIIKPGYQQPIDPKTLAETKTFFEALLKLTHPFMPFISEELWHSLNKRQEGEDIIISTWPETAGYDNDILSAFEKTENIITQIRNFRKQNNIASKVKIELFIKSNENTYDGTMDPIVLKMGNLSHIEQISEKLTNSSSFLVGLNEYFIPFGDHIDIESEKKKINEELDHLKGFLKGVQAKLSNEKFVSGAPEQVVNIERKKEKDASDKIALLTDKLSTLN
jgi:valyl-tRNA synthetase